MHESPRSPPLPPGRTVHRPRTITLSSGERSSYYIDARLTKQHHLGGFGLGEDHVRPGVTRFELGAIDEDLLIGPALSVHQPLPGRKGVILLLPLIAYEQPRHDPAPDLQRSEL
jgi:hypothetical protein